MKTHTDTHPVKLTTNEARAARRVKGMPLVLGISTAAAIIIAMICFAVFT